MASIQIVSFANYDVSDPLELVPEESNCCRRKPPNFDPATQKPGQFQKLDAPMGLDLQNCLINTLHGIGQLVNAAFFVPQNLRLLDIRCNQLSSLSGLEELPQLAILYAQGNKLATLEDLAILKQLQNLESLSVAGNPLTRIPNYRLKLILMFPQLRRIENAGVTYNDRCKAEFDATYK